jgi:aminoglycoside phosphotransferase (APT) family kinase protein
MAWSKPETQQIREALRRYAAHLADAPIEFLAEGWEFWAFRAGEHVLRFPKADRGFAWKLGDQSSAESLRIERALGPELAHQLSTPVTVIDVYGELGPNGAPFAGHGFIEGVVIMYDAKPSAETWARRRLPHDEFGREVGRLIRELHSFPAERAVDLGVPLFDGARLRNDRERHYEDVIRRAFPLISCEARTHVQHVYEAYLNDARSFEFDPVLVHSDLAVNTLMDPATGRLCGLMDFSDAAVTDPSLDLWLPLYGLEHLGIEDQMAACLAEAGISEAGLERMRPQLAFQHLRYPLIGVLQGLTNREDDLVQQSILELNASLPPDLRCE